ncbi:MAG TPA: histidine kinase [Thermoleophilaceae bacterium]|nr:histidine kinase [Thermoleophilaceae bacterium]
MKALGLRPVPVALFLLTQLITVVAVALSLGVEPHFDTLLFALHGFALAGAGALVASRQRGNPMGWIFLALALAGTVGDLVQGYGLRGTPEGWTGAVTAQWIDTWIAFPLVMGWAVVFLLFPDGRLPSPRWRAVPWLAGLCVVPATVGWALSPDRDAEIQSAGNPVAVTGPLPEALLWVGVTVYMGVLLASILSLVVRFRRSRGIERQQIKWFALAAAVNGVVLPITVVVGFFSGWLIQAATVTALTLLPIAACVAILRYRLYDVDRTINRTLVYAALTVTLAAAYVATTLVLGTGLGADTAWRTAAATLVVALAFGPLRAWLQDQVDRRYNRSRYAGLQRVAAFLEDLRAGRAAPERIEEVLREVLSDPDLELRYLPPEAELDDGDDGRERSVVSRAGAPIAMLVHGPGFERTPDLDDVVDAAGLAFEIGRLRVDLRRHLDEVTASRARLVAAGNEERRRIERDLHDGAQQRLVAIGLALRHAQSELDGSASEVSQALDGAVSEIRLAIEELRELASGVRPALLDGGLAPAFEDLARRAPLRVTVTATPERFPDLIETAGYFVATEGLTNAIKHSGASTVVLTAERCVNGLRVSVTDDGRGGAEPAEGSGLSGLIDRVEAQGGVLTIVNGAGTGTRLTAELPCG